MSISLGKSCAASVLIVVIIMLLLRQSMVWAIAPQTPDKEQRELVESLCQLCFYATGGVICDKSY